MGDLQRVRRDTDEHEEDERPDQREDDGENGSASAARQRAVRGLGDIGPAAREAFPGLLKRWQAERSAYQKEEIARALKAIDAKAAREAGVK
jgi:hypothetical protein